jgi:hypothetical protein
LVDLLHERRYSAIPAGVHRQNGAGFVVVRVISGNGTVAAIIHGPYEASGAVLGFSWALYRVRELLDGKFELVDRTNVVLLGPLLLDAEVFDVVACNIA